MAMASNMGKNIQKNLTTKKKKRLNKNKETQRMIKMHKPKPRTVARTSRLKIKNNGGRVTVRLRPTINRNIIMRARHLKPVEKRLLVWGNKAKKLIESYALGTINAGQFRKNALEEINLVEKQLNRKGIKQASAVKEYLKNWIEDPIILIGQFKRGEITKKQLEYHIRQKLNLMIRNITTLTIP